MSITASEMTPADIAAVTNNGGNGFGNGFGGDGWWVLLLWLAMMNGGWGMGGMYGGMMGGMGGFGLYPWLDNSQNINDGFRDQMLNNNVTSIRDGIANLSTQLCGCCGDMQMALANGFAGVEQGANARQIANMQQAFAAQTAMMQGFTASQAQLAQASADNRLGIANLGSDIAREACATRTNDTQNTQAILNVINGGIQSIKDQLCQDKIDAKNDEIAQLRQEVLFARGKDSQDLQTAQITNDIYTRLSNCPVPSTPVYGRTPIFTCNNNTGCGCGCGSF